MPPPPKASLAGRSHEPAHGDTGINEGMTLPLLDVTL